MSRIRWDIRIWSSVQINKEKFVRPLFRENPTKLSRQRFCFCYGHPHWLLDRTQEHIETSTNFLVLCTFFSTLDVFHLRIPSITGESSWEIQSCSDIPLWTIHSRPRDEKPNVFPVENLVHFFLRSMARLRSPVSADHRWISRKILHCYSWWRRLVFARATAHTVWRLLSLKCCVV